MTVTASHTKYGAPIELWDATKDRMRSVLGDRARAGRTIAYSELVATVGPVKLEPDSYALAAMLGEISEEEDALGRGMLSVVVVHKDGDMRPGPGFFQLAKKLGRDASDIDRCWVDEFRRVIEVWKRGSG
jgi:hypothetical protein